VNAMLHYHIVSVWAWMIDCRPYGAADMVAPAEIVSYHLNVNGVVNLVSSLNGLRVLSHGFCTCVADNGMLLTSIHILLSNASIIFGYRIPNTELSLTFKLVAVTRVYLHSFTVCMLFVAYRPYSGCI